MDGCALRPRMLPSRQLFFTQLMDMFDVVDFPVAGYDMPGTVTQLHLLITRSALDYRSVGAGEVNRLINQSGQVR